MRVQCADVHKVLCSVHKMNLGGNVVVLDGEKSYMQIKTTMKKTKIEKMTSISYMYGCRRGRNKLQRNQTRC